MQKGTKYQENNPCYCDNHTYSINDNNKSGNLLGTRHALLCVEWLDISHLISFSY